MAAKTTLTDSSSTLKPLSFPVIEKDLKCYYDPNYDLPIICMLCEASFEKKATQRSTAGVVTDDGEIGDAVRRQFLQHLFKEHKLVINRVCDIASYRW